MKRLIFDTETTGLIKSLRQPLESQPKVIELFAILVDAKWKELGRVSALIQPGLRLDPVITKITSITDAMLTKCPPFGAITPKWEALVKKADQVVGHNVTFDIDMIDLEYRRMEKVCPWPKLRLCTVEATEFLKGHRMKLQDLHEHLLGKKFDGAHRAESDVMAVLAVLKELDKRGHL